MSGQHDPPSARIVGLDLARALALLGMIVVHFDLTTAGPDGRSGLLAAATEALQGRAAATFVVLAGIGTSLGTARARVAGGPPERTRARLRLLRRGAFLFVLGCLFLPIWDADILHCYGVWLAAASALLFVPSAALWAVIGLVSVVALGFLSGFDYFEHWDLTELTYAGLATPTGFARHTLFDGWNPFFPWFGLFAFGLWLGRLDLAAASTRRWLGALGALSAALVYAAAAAFAPPLEGPESALMLLIPTALPPMPGFQLAGAGIACVVIAASCWIADRVPPSALRPLCAAGRMALTHYVGHVVVGLGVLEAFGLLDRGLELPAAVAAAMAFFLVAALASSLWLRRFRHGPLEALLRAIS